MTLTIRSDIFYSYDANSKSENIQQNPVLSITRKEENEHDWLKTHKKKASVIEAAQVLADDKENSADAEMTTDELLSALYLTYFLGKIM